MGRIRSILIIEELLACTEAWDQATASLRNEAAAMVSALLADAASSFNESCGKIPLSQSDPRYELYVPRSSANSVDAI